MGAEATRRRSDGGERRARRAEAKEKEVRRALVGTRQGRQDRVERSTGAEARDAVAQRSHSSGGRKVIGTKWEKRVQRARVKANIDEKREVEMEE